MVDFTRSSNSDMPTGTNTFWFISFDDVPADADITKVRVVVADRPKKPQLRHVRWVARGDLINYPGVTSTRTANLITCKCMFNSVISTHNARFCNIDLKHFYLGTPLPRPEYMKIPVRRYPFSAAY